MKRFLTAALCAFTAQGTFAAETECYDLKVKAKAVSQIPSVYPQSDDPDVIIMSWPWFLDLKVKRVIDGEMSGNMIQALAVMHVGYVRKNLTWFLRKNSAGIYNVIRSNDSEALARCHVSVGPAKPPITPGPGQTYADLRKEGEAAYRGLGGEPE